MSAEDELVIERYLTTLRQALRQLHVSDANEVAGEIQNHIAEARSAGKSASAVLKALGSPNKLARAYAVELLLKRDEGARPAGVERQFRLALVLAVGSVVTLVVSGALGIGGFGLAAIGFLMFMVALLQTMHVTVPGVHLGGITPYWAMIVGPTLLVSGLVALALLWLYIRVVSRTVTRLLPARAHEATQSNAVHN